MPDTARPLTRAECEEAQAICEKATKGPWRSLVESDGDEVHFVTIPEINRMLHDPEWADAEDAPKDIANAAFIASSRTALPRALASYRAAMEALRALLDEENISDADEYRARVLLAAYDSATETEGG